MQSYGLKPWDEDDAEEGVMILEAFAKDDAEEKAEEKAQEKQEKTASKATGK